MPSLVIMLDGATINQVTLTKPYTTVGRRPTNDVVIDNLAVSGEHAVLRMHDGVVEIDDLHSTNGTYVNGRRTGHQKLHHGDVLGLGRYQIRFVDLPASMTTAAGSKHASALVRVLTGPGAGREVELSKVVTTIGKPGETVASITHRPHGFMLAHVEGKTLPRVNGQTITDTQSLQDGDRIMLADVEMEFVAR